MRLSRYAGHSLSARTLLRCLPAAALSIGAGAAMAQDVTAPGDPVTPTSTNFPAAENPPKAIDNSGSTKYLNFDKLNTGFTVTPSGTGVVQAISIMTANDSPERDPTSFTLEGSNDGTNFTMIAQGPLTPSTVRFALASTSFANSITYSQYRVRFPTVRTPNAANSMQVAEVQLLTNADILSPGDGFAITYPPGGSSPAGQGPINLWDNQVGTKLGVFNGNAGPTVIDVTPGAGASVVTGIDIFGANDDVAFPGRTPTSVTLSGSNDGVNFTQLFTGPLVQFTTNYQDQQFAVANSLPFLRYRLEFGPSNDGFMQLGEIQLLGKALGSAPANDQCAQAQNIAPGATSGSNINATGTDITPCGPSDSKDVWFSYTATASGPIEVNTIGPGVLDTTLAVYNGCGGTLLGCDDNSHARYSRVRWTAQSGVNYRIRVAGANDSTGSFTLNLDTAPATHTDNPVRLNYNFNGMVQTGEAGIPDDLNGYRSISDRGLMQTGSVGSIEVGLEGGTGIPYSVVTTPFTLDIVQLGDRNTIDNGNHAFDLVPNGDNVGVQPSWLPDPNQRSPQTTDVSNLGLVFGANTRVGVLFQSSNGGTAFDMTLNYNGGGTVTVTLEAPDWFGAQTVPPPFPGVESQTALGLFDGAGNVDSGDPSVDLNVVEAIVSTQSLIDAGYGDFNGQRLSSISFGNSTNFNSATAIFAVTVRDAAVSLACNVADICGIGGPPSSPDGLLTGDDFNAFVAAFANNDPLADIVGIGGLPPPDGLITGDDFNAFISAFAAGCP